MKLLLGSSSDRGSLVIMGDITCGWGISDFGSSDAHSTCLIRTWKTHRQRQWSEAEWLTSHQGGELTGRSGPAWKHQRLNFLVGGRSLVWAFCNQDWEWSENQGWEFHASLTRVQSPMKGCIFLGPSKRSWKEALEIHPQHFYHQGPVSWKTIFPMNQGGGWFGDDSSTLHLLCTFFLLLLHQLHLR